MRPIHIPILLCVICCVATSPFHASAQQNADTSTIQHDGSHDFDFEIGNWKTSLKRLQHPLTGSTIWVEYNGTSNVSKIWGGMANLVELDVSGPAGHIQALSLRLYNP